MFGGLIGGTINLIANWNNADNFWQGLGYFGVGAAAGVATAAIGGAGIGAFEAAVFSGTASGGLIGGGNTAMQGGGSSDIFAGAVGGALIGGSTAFLGASITMGISSIGNYRPDAWYGGNSNIHFPGAGKIINPSIGDAVNYYTNGFGSNLSNFFSSNSSLLSNIGGSFSGMGAGNLFHFTSGSVTPQKVNLQSNTINGFVDWFSYLQQNRSEHYLQGIYYHVDDIVDHRTILNRHRSTGMNGEHLGGIENSVQWGIADANYRKRSNWNDNFVDAPFADNPYDGYYRIRLMLNRRTKISLTTNSYDLYIKMYDRIYGRRIY